MKGNIMATNTKSKTAAAKKAEETVQAEINKANTPIVPKEIDPSQYITVLNGFQGKLIYKSPRTGEKFTWDAFGDEQEMELRDLKNVKSSCKKMFENNWLMFREEDEWVIDYLGIRQYYKNSLRVDNFDSVFECDPSEIASRIGSISDGLKRSVSYRARQLIADGKIDSRKMISALEEALNTELIER